jgi:autotransporter-associated beta strand protein
LAAKPALEGLEERAVPAVTFSYNTGTNILSFESQSPDQFTLTNATPGFTFSSLSVDFFGNDATLVTSSIKNPPLTTSSTTLAVFDTSVKNLVPTIAAGSKFSLDRDATFTSINGAGEVNISGTKFNNWTATLTGGSGTASFSGALTNGIAGINSPLSLTVNQAGFTQILSGTNDYAGATQINAGTLQVNGKNTNSPVTIAGGTLSGSGTVATVTMNSGNLSPGAPIGIFNTGNLSFSGGTFSAKLDSTFVYSQANVTGTVTLGSNTTLTLSPTFTPSSGNTFTIINNDGTDAISGTFKGLAEGAKVNVNGIDYTISYKGGTGNDVVLTAQSALVGTTTSVATSVSPSVYGQAVTFTATVTQASGSTIPSGTVTFTNGATTLGSGTLDSSGKASISLSSLAVGGPYTITASYVASGSFTASSGTINQTVNKATTTSTVSATPNPSVYGQSVTFTATVSTVAPGVGSPSGTFSFFDGSTNLGSGTITAGVATLTTSSLSTGAHSITVQYNGDGNFNGSTSSAITQTVDKASTSTLLTSGLNPSTFGQSVTFTATVSVVSPGVGTPAGTVNFFNGATLLGSGTLSANEATFTTSSITAGTNGIIAVYAGDTNFTTSTSNNLSQIVNKASTTTVVASNLNPSLFGNSVTFTATVSTIAPGAGVADGNVDFFRDSTLLGTATLDASGLATISSSALPAGISAITAVYAGSGNFNRSISPGISQVVNQAPIITSANTATFKTGDPGNFTFTATGYPTNFAWSTNGTLPAGVTLSSTGLLSGTPAAGTGGQYNFTVTVGNGINPDATQAFTLIVNQPPEFTNVNNAETFYGVPFNFQYTSSGYPTTFSYVVTAGALPSGLTLTSGGLLSGTVTPGVQGTFPFTVSSSNGISPDAFQNFTLLVRPTGGMYDYNSATGELSISLADDVSLEMIESGGTTSFILSKPGDTPFFVPAPGSAVLSGNLTDRINTTNLAGGLSINNSQTSTSGTTNDLKFTAGSLDTSSIKIDLTLNQGYGGISFLSGTKTNLSGTFLSITNGDVSIDGSLLADIASFNGSILNPNLELTGPVTNLNSLKIGFTTGGSVMLGNSIDDLIQVDQGIITFVPTSLGGLIGTDNAPIYLTEVSLNSETLLDTNNLGNGNSITLLGFLQNQKALILDTGLFDTSFLNASAVDADIVALNGGIELGGLGSSVTFSRNSSVTSQKDIIELNGANYTSESGNLASLIADDVTIDLAARVGGSGSYLLAPFSPTTKTFLGSAAGTLQPGLALSQNEFDTFSTDVNYVQIGQNSYAGTIVSGVLNSVNALYLVNNGGGGKVLVNGLLTVTGGDTNNLGLYVNGSGSTTVLSANIVTAGVDVLIDDAVQVDGANILIDTTGAGAVPAGANVTITGGTRGIFATKGATNNLEVDAGTGGTVELGYLRGFGTGGVASLVNDLIVGGKTTTIFSETDLGGDLLVESDEIHLNANINASGGIELFGAIDLTNNVALYGTVAIVLDGTLDGAGWNLDLASNGSLVATGAITDINNLVLADFAGFSTFAAVNAQNLNIQTPTSSGAVIDFTDNLMVPGFFATGAGDYTVQILGAQNSIGGPLTTANLLLTIGDNDDDVTSITNGFNRKSVSGNTLATNLQGTLTSGGAVSLWSVYPTNPGATLEVDGQTIDIGFNTDIGTEFQSVSLYSVGDVNLNDGMLMVTGGLNIVGGSISQTFYSKTQVGGLTYLYAYGDINMNALNNDIGLLQVSGNNVTLYTLNGVEFDGALISGNLNLYTDNNGVIGNITQGKNAVQVYGNANFFSLGDIVLSNPLNVFTGTVTFSGNSVSLGGKSDINLGGGIANGDLTVNTSFASGDITQTGPLDVIGLTTLNAGTGDVVLTNSLNSFGTGPVSVIANGANLAAAGAIDLGTSAIQADMALFAAGAVTQSGILNVGDWLNIRSYDTVTLTNAGNKVGALAIAADAATFVESGALTLGGVQIDDGDFTLTVGGNLTQSGPVQVVSPGAVTTINAAGFDVILPDLRNDLIRAVVTANNLVLADQNNVTLENSTLAGDLEVSAVATVTLLSVIATGDSNVNAGQDIFGGSSTFGSGAGNIHSFDAGRYIDFTNFGNPSRFNGSTYFNGTIVDVTATGDLILAAGNASIFLSLVTDGSISQDKSQGYLNVSGNMILEAAGNITLDDPGNVLVGNIASSATNITLLNTSQILLDTTTATGDLTLIAPAGVDQINPVSVGGKLDIQAASDSVNLTNTKNSLPTIALVADSADIVTQGAVNLLPSTVGNFKLRAGGAITQSGGALTVDVLDLSAFGQTGPAAITLDDATNRLRVLNLMGGNTVIQDTGYLALGLVHANNLSITIPGDLYQTGLLGVDGILTITAQDVSLPNPDNTITGAITLNANSAMIVNSADINLATVAVNEGLALDTPGNISQTGSIKAGTYDLAAGVRATLSDLSGGTGSNIWTGGTLTLSGINNLKGGLTSHGSAVVLRGGSTRGEIQVLSGSLSGNGSARSITMDAGTLSFGLPLSVSGSQLTAGSLYLGAGSTLKIQIPGLNPGEYSSILAGSTGALPNGVNIEGAQLVLNADEQVRGLLGNQVVLIDNQSTTPVTGTFNDLPEGAPLTLNGQDWVISYEGGDGNDVVITRQRYVPPATGPVLAQPFSLGAGSLVASLGDGKVGIWSDDGQYQVVTPFPGYRGPLNVNTLTRSGNAKPDSIVVSVAGPSVPHVLVLDALSGRVALSFYAFDPKFLGGVTVAGGVTKLNGDQTTVILCGAGAGTAPAVSVFDAVDGYSKGAFYAFSEEYKGGVRVALSSPLADGTSYVVVGSTINSHVVSFLLDDYTNAVSSFYAFPPANCPDGLYVAAADLDKNGQMEIITGAANGKTSPQVAVFSLEGKLKKTFNAFDMNFLGGVRVAVNDIDADGDLDILAASGPGAQGTLNAFNYNNLALIDSMFISDSVNGVVGGNNFVTVPSPT